MPIAKKTPRQVENKSGQIPVSEVVNAFKELGTNEQQIKRRLKSLGLRGVPEDGRHCILAEYLKYKFPGVSVSVEDVDHMKVNGAYIRSADEADRMLNAATLPPRLNSVIGSVIYHFDNFKETISDYESYINKYKDTIENRHAQIKQLKDEMQKIKDSSATKNKTKILATMSSHILEHQKVIADATKRIAKYRKEIQRFDYSDLVKPFKSRKRTS